MNTFKRTLLKHLMAQKDGNSFCYLAEDAYQKAEAICQAILEAKNKTLSLRGISPSLDKTCDELGLRCLIFEMSNFMKKLNTGIRDDS